MAAETPKFIVFTDFDGTVTLTDSNDHLTDNIGYGITRRRELNLEILADRWSFRDAFADMLASVALHKSIPECIEILQANIKLDPGFAAFYRYCKSAGIPVIILSGGMDPIIRALLSTLLSEEEAAEIEIISNGVARPEGAGWEITFRDESHFGHDKSRAIRPYREGKYKGTTLFYAGDGVSDLSAARETDLLFAKRGHDLITYCQREKVPFKVFGSFEDIMRDVQSVVEGGKTTEQVAEEGAKEDRRIHFGNDHDPLATSTVAGLPN